MTDNKELTLSGDVAYLSKLIGDSTNVLEDLGGSSPVSYIKAANGVFSLILGKENQQELGRTLDVVIVGANGDCRGYFKDKYVPGAATIPTCHSVDGIKPDSTVVTPCNKTCDGCPKAVRGSGDAFTDGALVAACANYKRLMVIPQDSLKEGILPTFYRLDIKKGSFVCLSAFVKTLKANKIASYSYVVTRMSFSNKAGYSQIEFKPLRVLTQDEVAIVSELVKNPLIKESLMAEMIAPKEDVIETKTETKAKQKAETISDDEIIGEINENDFNALAEDL